MDSDFPGVLAFCNDVRSLLDRRPVAKLRKGMPSETFGCVVANTINYQARNRVEVNESTVELDYNILERTPEAVADFIRAFDDHEMPELEGAGWAE